MEEVVADLLLAEPVGRGVEVVGELPDGAEVGLLGALAEAGQLEVLEHPLAECRGHVQVLSQRSEETPLRKKPVSRHRRLARDRRIGDLAHDEDRARRRESRSNPGSGRAGAAGVRESARYRWLSTEAVGLPAA